MLIKYYAFLLIIVFSLSASTSPAEQKIQVHTRKLTPKRDLFMMEKKLFDLINSERRTRNLNQFKLDTKIQKAARAHSKDMVKRRYFDHVNPDKENVGTRLKAAKIKWTIVAENIASNKNTEDPVETAFKSWLESKDHYKNIISAEYELSGIGIAQAQDDTFYFTQIFVKQ
ncbi:MAG: CAP domain-containing protein [Nitrospirota bacterium]